MQTHEVEGGEKMEYSQRLDIPLSHCWEYDLLINFLIYFIVYLKKTFKKITHDEINQTQSLHSSTNVYTVRKAIQRGSFPLDFTLLYTIECVSRHASITRTKVLLKGNLEKLSLFPLHVRIYIHPSSFQYLIFVVLLPPCINFFYIFFLTIIKFCCHPLFFPRVHLIPTASQGTCPMHVTSFCTDDPVSGKCFSAS